jgi:hypothetical protein
VTEDATIPAYYAATRSTYWTTHRSVSCCSISLQKDTGSLSHQTGVQRMVSIHVVVCVSNTTAQSSDIPPQIRQKECGLANSSNLASYFPVVRGTNGGSLSIKLKKIFSVFM